MGASGPSLLDLSDDVLCVLLRYLDATSLYFLARTCTQLEELIRNDFTLWQRIDARRPPNHEDKVTYCLNRCYDDGNSWTHTFLLCGDVKSDILLPCDFFTRINDLEKITILALENQTIDGSKINAKSFPGGLIEFSLKRSVIGNNFEFFKGSGDHFKKLRVLILDECDWLKSSSFMPISKYPNLEILSIYKCRNLEDSIAYLALAGQGFKMLKIFDGRLSFLGNTLIRAIYKAPCLLAIYLHNYDLSYKLDFFKRKLALAEGAHRKNYLSKVDESEFENLTANQENGLNFEDLGTLDDNGLIDYISIQSIEKSGTMPVSVLYTDPYNKCTCNYDRKQFNSINPPDAPSDDNNDPFIRTLKQQISETSSQLNQNQQRSLQVRRAQSPSTTTVIHFPSTGNNSNVIVMDLPNLRNRRRHQSDEPPVKRQKTDDSAPGPSGLNRNESDSENDDSSGRRPPTPHPDIVFEDPIRQASVRIYFRDSPIVQIERINEIQNKFEVPLRRLCLRGYKRITNNALNYIKKLDLELLDLSYTSVSIEAIEDYLKSHPLCRIVHQKFCTCPINLHF